MKKSCKKNNSVVCLAQRRTRDFRWYPTGRSISISADFSSLITDKLTRNDLWDSSFVQRQILAFTKLQAARALWLWHGLAPGFRCVKEATPQLLSSMRTVSFTADVSNDVRWESQGPQGTSPSKIESTWRRSKGMSKSYLPSTTEDFQSNIFYSSDCHLVSHCWFHKQAVGFETNCR